MAEIIIYSDIDSIDGFGPQAMRDGLAAAGGDPVTIRLNSQGGNVIDGLACYNLLRQYPGEKTVVIDGMALSIASVIVCGGDRVQMAENAWMMIHNPHNEAKGDGDDLRSMAGLLDGMRDQLAAVYSAKSGKAKDEILALMDAETWMTGPQAKEAGFVDEVTSALEVAAAFDASRFSRPPKATKTEKTDMPAATYQELRKAFPKASAEFIVKCQEKDLPLDKARAEYDEDTAKALEETTKELAKARAEMEEMKKEMECKAKAEEEEKAATEAKAKAMEEEKKDAAQAKAKAGVKAAGSGRGASGGTARDAWACAVQARVKDGMPKAKAVRAVAIEEPELQAAYVAEVNG